LLRPVGPGAAEPAWEGKSVILTRAGVWLQAPEGKDIAPKTAGVARDLMFPGQERKEGALRNQHRLHGVVPADDALDDLVQQVVVQLDAVGLAVMHEFRGAVIANPQIN
jgi:hypothetical protein